MKLSINRLDNIEHTAPIVIIVVEARHSTIHWYPGVSGIKRLSVYS
jgi:hypothetical protein